MNLPVTKTCWLCYHKGNTTPPTLIQLSDDLLWCPICRGGLYRSPRNKRCWIAFQNEAELERIKEDERQKS